MLINYVKVALRNLFRQKGYTAINIIGLSIGLTSFILIGLFVYFELSYDTFHQKSDRIFRIAQQLPDSQYLGNTKTTMTPPPLAQVLMDEFPEVDHVTQVISTGMLIEKGSNRFYDDGLYATDHFFDVFDFPLIVGNPGTVLRNPNTIVLTGELAQKYFGAENPLGQQISVTRIHPWWSRTDESVEMKVVGVVAQPPPNSHISFDFIISMASWEGYQQDREHWNHNNYLTYAALIPGFSINDFETKLSSLSLRNIRMEQNRQDLENIATFFPQPIENIHLRSHMNFELGANGNINYVYLFSAIALFILIIAGINYINIATARSFTRTREIGVRKAPGARRGQLVVQFLGEAVWPSFLALAVAVGLTFLLLPLFNQIIARNITLDFEQNGVFFLILVLIGLAIGIVSGSYPAFYLSSLKPIRAIKDHHITKKNRFPARNVLLITQFSITIMLLVGMVVIKNQLHYIKNADTGVDRDHMISVEVFDTTVGEQYDALKQALNAHSGILGVTGSLHDPTSITSMSRTGVWQDALPDNELSYYLTAIQSDYIDVLELELVEGVTFSETSELGRQQGIIINEAMKNQLGWAQAVGKWIDIQGRELTVIGVVKDYNYLSFHQEIEPLALYHSPNLLGHLLVKAHPAQIRNTITFLEDTMNAYSPSFPFTYQFLDDKYNNMYQAETRLGALFGYFSFLSIIIACLGLLGLAAIIASQRTKELGIRKVLGAAPSDIIVLMSKDLLGLVAIAFVIGAPIAYIGLNIWLKQFAYRIEIGWELLIVAGVMTMVLAWLSISYQAIRAALMNPVLSLKNE